MLAIKLSRIGKKHRPHFRIIVLEKSKDPWGDFKENLGSYNPRTKELVIKADRVKHWIDQGAQPTNTVHNILVAQGIVDGEKRRVSRISKKRQVKLDEKAKEAKKEEVKEEKPAEEKAPKAEDKPVEEKKAEETKTAPVEEKKDSSDKVEEKK